MAKRRLMKSAARLFICGWPKITLDHPGAICDKGITETQTGVNEMKTIGTLEEIGAQVGDVVEWRGEFVHKISKIESGPMYYSESCEDGSCLTDIPDWRIISHAAKSPVRTVTRKEIVPGVYGKVNVADTAGQWIEIEFIRDYGHTGRPRLTASDLTAAIATLTEIRDAMQDNP